MNEIAKNNTIRYVPATLFFTPPAHAWVDGQLFMGGRQIGTSKATVFTEDELQNLLEIMNAAAFRHMVSINKN